MSLAATGTAPRPLPSGCAAAASATRARLPYTSSNISAGSWALIIYSALGPGALATYLQTKGQATVAATPSQVRGG